MNLFFLCLAILLTPLTALASEDPVHLIGALGDSHGEIEDTLAVAKKLYFQGARHLILTGDMVGFSSNDPDYKLLKDPHLPPHKRKEVLTTLKKRGDTQLEHLLDGIHQIGFTKNHLFLMPGNWEKTWSPHFSEIFHHFGVPVSHDYMGKGIITIEGKRILISHYPRFPIPENLILKNDYEEDNLLFSSMSPLGYPNEKVDLAVFGHTHIPFAYFDTHRRGQMWVLNPGSLEKSRATDTFSKKLPRSYAIYNPSNEQIQIISIRGKILQSYDLRKHSRAFQHCAEEFGKF